MKNLILCIDSGELNSTLNRIKDKRSYEQQYFIVSPEISICSDSGLVAKGFTVIPLDIDVSIVNMQQIVYGYIDAINDVFVKNKNFFLGLDYLYKISYQIEGGGIQQEILNILCWIDYFSKILNDYKIERVILVENEKEFLAKEVLKSLCKTNKLQIQLLKNKTGRIRRTFFPQRESMNKVLYCFCKQMQLLVFYAKHFVRKQQLNENQFLAGIIICSNAQKHINWAMPIVHEFFRRGKTQVICFHADKTNQELKKRGYNSVCIEDFVTIKGALNALKEYKQFSREINKEIKKINGLKRKGVDFSTILYPEIFRYIKVEVLKNYLSNSCAKEYFKQNTFLCIREWGDFNFVESRIVYYNTLHQKIAPIFFKEDYIYSFNVHFKEMDPLIEDYKFKCNKEEIDNLLLMGKKADKCFLINSTTLVKKYLNNCRLSQSDKLKNILFAPSYPAIGYGSFVNYINNITVLINFFGLENKYNLYIKNHPNETKKNIKFFESHIQNHNNIVLLPKEQSIEKALEGSDIVITDVSTVILDALTAGKPVICIASKSDYNRIKDMKGIIIFYNVEDACKLLQRIMSDEEIYKDWKRECLEKQNKYFENNYINDNVSLEPEKEVVQTLCKIIQVSALYINANERSNCGKDK